MSIDSILNNVLSSLHEVPGVDAVVLGGSRARGDFKADSDIDIGIYYSDGEALDLGKLAEAAAALDDDHRENLVTRIGEWGPWINGGGWLIVGGIHLDFLLRDLNKVKKVIDDCCNGTITIDYQPGHPHGFVNAIYMAEIHFCQPLWDPRNIVAELKAKTHPYPSTFKKGIIDKFLWEAEFSLYMTGKSAVRKDVVYAAGNVYRSVACLIQVLFALNETYIMNEKGAVRQMETFRLLPQDFAERVNGVFTLLSDAPEQLRETHEQTALLVQDVKELI